MIKGFLGTSTFWLRHLMIPAFAAGFTNPLATAAPKKPQTIYDMTVTDIDGKPVTLSKYKGNVMLIVNVASKCGYTSQYEGLQSLYDRYRDQGFVILGFPSNNFLWQEPGTNGEVKEFCRLNYNVTFDMFSKISVKGSDQAPLYKFLTSPETNAKFSGGVKWNFQKYLIDRSGTIVGRFSPRTEPLSEEMTSAVEAALKRAPHAE